MEILMFIYVFGLLGTVASLFLFIYVKNKSPLHEENGMVARYSVACSISINNIRATYPLSQLRIYDNFFVVRSVQSKLIWFKNVESCEIKKYFLAKVVSIHTKDGTKVRIWAKDIEEIFSRLEKHLVGNSSPK